MFLRVLFTQGVENIVISVKGYADQFCITCREVFRKKREYNCLLCGKSIFSFKKSCQTIFQSGCTIVHSHWQGMSHPVSPHPCRSLVSSPFFVSAILIGV